ncbi:hypothetical protein K160097B7_15910 [[Clostridium] hylemonae]|uniref:hypothetical protein n=1 Tax=[Clostridium] hylemonae TaxID=89153 RepID=UPI0036F23FAE
MLGMFSILSDEQAEGPGVRGVEGRSEADVGAVAAERAGIRHGNVITNNIPESL